jgi:hypothetical protein
MPMRATGRASREYCIRIEARRVSSGSGTCQELLLDEDSFDDDTADSVGMRTSSEVAEQETSKVGMHSLVTADKLVGEGKTRHKTPFLEPKDGSERAREEDAFDSGESNETFCKC